MLAMATYGVEEVQLQPGDKIVAYSDGLTEAANTEGKFFDMGRMKTLILANARSSCSKLHGDLMRAVDTFTEGAIQSDDITAVVIEYQPH
jgi:serine phosphatase RsbU (regulator of sigma subunit)